MDLVNAQTILASRLYDWSLRDLIREMAAGCPVMSLAGLNNRFVAGFVSWTKAMPREQHEPLARNLVARAHEAEASRRRQSISLEEQQRFNRQFFDQVSLHEHSLPPLKTADRSLPSFQPVNPDHCIQSVYEALPEVLGKPVRRRLRVQTTKCIEDWKLITEFWFYKPDTFLFCEFQFVRKDGRRVIGPTSPFPRNLFMFYGITSTKVFVPSQADSGPMAKAMVKLAEHLVGQADPLFGGLGGND